MNNEPEHVILLYWPSLGCYLDDHNRGWVFPEAVHLQPLVQLSVRATRADIKVRMQRIGVG